MPLTGKCRPLNFFILLTGSNVTHVLFMNPNFSTHAVVTLTAKKRPAEIRARALVKQWVVPLTAKKRPAEIRARARGMYFIASMVYT